MTALILTYFDSDLEYILKTDLSDYALEDMLLQYDENSILCSVIYFS